jgi:hypothetical protein
MSESEMQIEDPEDVKKALAPLHENALIAGVVLALQLYPQLRSQLDVLEGIEQLCYEFRHASSLNRLTIPCLIRCSVAISEFSAALEGLVFQDEEGVRKVEVRDANTIFAGEQCVPMEYLVERIADALYYKEPVGDEKVGVDVSDDEKQVASELFRVLMELLYKGKLGIPAFKMHSAGTCMILEHEDA